MKWGGYATLYSVGQNWGIVDLVKHWLDLGYTSLLHGASGAVLGKKAAALPFLCRGIKISGLCKSRCA